MWSIKLLSLFLQCAYILIKKIFQTSPLLLSNVSFINSCQNSFCLSYYFICVLKYWFHYRLNNGIIKRNIDVILLYCIISKIVNNIFFSQHRFLYLTSEIFKFSSSTINSTVAELLLCFHLCSCTITENLNIILFLCISSHKPFFLLFAASNFYTAFLVVKTLFSPQKIYEKYICFKHRILDRLGNFWFFSLL